MPLRKKTGIPIPQQATATGAQPLAATAGPFVPVVLDVPMVRQTQDQWCWAACTAMIARFLQLPEPQQCELANFLHGQTNCCQRPDGARCNRPAPRYQDVVDVYNHVRIGLTGPDYPLLPATVKAELDAGRPFEVAWLWGNTNGGHVVVVYGYTATGLILVHDPYWGELTLSYAALSTARGAGRWVASYGRFKRM